MFLGIEKNLSVRSITRTLTLIQFLWTESTDFLYGVLYDVSTISYIDDVSRLILLAPKQIRFLFYDLEYLFLISNECEFTIHPISLQYVLQDSRIASLILCNR